MIQTLKRKFSFLYLQLTFIFVYAFAFVYSLVFAAKKKKGPVRKIAAVWYTPPDLTGSNLRLGEWKPFFLDKGIEFDNFHVGSISEFNRLLENGTWDQKYRFYRVNLIRRLKQFCRLRNYDLVWIDRGFVIAYPLKRAFFERCIKRMAARLVIDSTDGSDYESNPELVIDTMNQADRVTVGFDSLKDLFQERFASVVQFNWTIPENGYKIKTDYEIENLPVIGWMGSPGNFEHVKRIEPELAKVAEVIPFKFLYICRDRQEIEIPGATIEHRRYDDDYHELIAGFDIGIAPCFGATITHKGKIAMKHQEFLLCAIPQVCSPVAISEFVVDKRDVLIAAEVEDWSGILLDILKDKEKRKFIARNSRNVFESHYTYDSEFPKVFDALTKFD